MKVSRQTYPCNGVVMSDWDLTRYPAQIWWGICSSNSVWYFHGVEANGLLKMVPLGLWLDFLFKMQELLAESAGSSSKNRILIWKTKKLWPSLLLLQEAEVSNLNNLAPFGSWKQSSAASLWKGIATSLNRPRQVIILIIFVARKHGKKGDGVRPCLRDIPFHPATHDISCSIKSRLCSSSTLWRIQSW